METGAGAEVPAGKTEGREGRSGPEVPLFDFELAGGWL